ncbi:MAG: PqqD family protein [Myxococcales bacterium]|nr:PqqD family protein [Myxococcales bacterium]
MPSELTPIPSDMSVRVSPRVYARAFGDEIVLLDFGVGEYFGLDPIGAEIWRRLEAGETLARIADSLVERYEVTREVALGDIVALVDEMRDKGLLEGPTH